MKRAPEYHAYFLQYNLSHDIAGMPIYGSGDRRLYLMIPLVYVVFFNFMAMCPSDKRPRPYVFGAANKREKMLRLDNAVGGIRKIQTFFETPKPGEVDNSKGTPGNSNGDAVDVAPLVPAPEDEAAAEPAASKKSPRGPVVQELDLMLDRQPNGSRSLSMATGAFSRTMHIMGLGK